MKSLKGVSIQLLGIALIVLRTSIASITGIGYFDFFFVVSAIAYLGFIIVVIGLIVTFKCESKNE